MSSARANMDKAAREALQQFNLSEAEVKSYVDAFCMFDENHDGQISTSEIRDAIVKCGFKPSDKWVTDLILEADRDNSGTIEFPEFLKAMGVGLRVPKKAEVNVKEERMTQQSVSQSAAAAPAQNGDAGGDHDIDYPQSDSPDRDTDSPEPKELDMTLDQFGLAERTVTQAKTRHNLVHPTSVQMKLLQALPEDANILGLGRGRAGKSVGGVLATLKTVDLDVDKVQVLYVVYSKGMAGRVAGLLRDLAPNPTLKIYRAVSGTPFQRDIHTLFRSVNHVVVGTPGRMFDLVERNATDFSAVRLVIIDQADLILELPRRRGLLCDFITSLSSRSDTFKTVVLSRAMNKNVGAFKDSFLDVEGKDTQVVSGRPPRGMSRTSEGGGGGRGGEGRRRDGRRGEPRGPPEPIGPLKWAVVTGENEERLSETLLKKFFNEFIGKMEAVTKPEEPQPEAEQQNGAEEAAKPEADAEGGEAARPQRRDGRPVTPLTLESIPAFMTRISVPAAPDGPFNRERDGGGPGSRRRRGPSGGSDGEAEVAKNGLAPGDETTDAEGESKAAVAKDEADPHSEQRLEEYKAAIADAKEKGVHVLFYTSPGIGRGSRSLRLNARDAGVIFQGLRTDHITEFVNAGKDGQEGTEDGMPASFTRGQARALVTNYRFQQRRLHQDENEVEGGRPAGGGARGGQRGNQGRRGGPAKGGDDRKRVDSRGDRKPAKRGDRQNRQRRRRIYPGQEFRVVGPATISMRLAEERERGAKPDENAAPPQEMQSVEVKEGMVLVGRVIGDESAVDKAVESEEETAGEE